MANSHLIKQYNLILIRYGEIWLKSQKVKIRMLKILINNIKGMLKKKNITFNKYQLSKDSSRILFFFKNEDIPIALEVLKNVFGIHSVSPALRTSNKLDNICERTLEVAKEILEKYDTFAIRVKRSGKHDYTSLEVAKIVGKKVLDSFSYLNLKVNLTNPKKVIFIEIRNAFSYIFSEIINSKWGGLPIETQKRVLVMDIGKINDLIAGFLILKRGCTIYPILFEIQNNNDFFDTWVSNWKEVVEYTPFFQFILRKVNITNILKVVEQKNQNKKYMCGICKLIRLEILSILAKNLELNLNLSIRAITDGVSLNQSTFCPDNVDFNTIALNYLFSNYPIFTPIVGLDLNQIDDLKNKISNNLKELDYCEFKPKNQEFDLNRLKELYKLLDISDLIKQSLQKVVEVKIF